MAQLNKVLLGVQVISDPKIYQKPKTGELWFGNFLGKAIGMNMSGIGEIATRVHMDCPVILSQNEELLKKMSYLHKGDCVVVFGVITSKEVIKESNCPHCGATVANLGVNTYITPIDIYKERDGKDSHNTATGKLGPLDDEEGFEWLKVHKEISNRVAIIGGVCKGPIYYTDKQGREYCSFEIAASRRYRIPESTEEERVDYIWVKVYGKKKVEETKRLQTGSMVLIDGRIQTRNIERSIACDSCGGKFPYKEPVAELVAGYIGYLSNCKPAENGEEDEPIDEETENGEDPMAFVPEHNAD